MYPQYRKYVNNSSFFKIISDKLFNEIKKTGSDYVYFEVESKSFFEMQLIKDMLACANNHWEIIDEDEYNRAFDKIKKGS